MQIQFFLKVCFQKVHFIDGYVFNPLKKQSSVDNYKVRQNTERILKIKKVGYTEKNVTQVSLFHCHAAFKNKTHYKKAGKRHTGIIYIS